MTVCHARFPVRWTDPVQVITTDMQANNLCKQYQFHVWLCMACYRLILEILFFYVSSFFSNTFFMILKIRIEKSQQFSEKVQLISKKETYKDQGTVNL